jgi:hypothetical protein
MKKSVFILFIALLPSALFAQQFYALTGGTNTIFDYKDSNGEGLQDAVSLRQLHLNFGLRKQLGESIFHWKAGLSNYRYAIASQDSIYQKNYRWELSYIGVDLGLDAEVWSKQRFHLLVHGSASPQFLFQGRQHVNNSSFDLKGVEQFDKPFFFLQGGMSFMYCVDDRLAVTGGYTYGRGIGIGQKEDTESLKIKAHHLSVGLAVSIKACDYCFKKHFKD